jgi:uncharacterized membrane protein
MGTHHARHASPTTGRGRRAGLVGLVLAGLVTIAALAWLWPSEDVQAAQPQGGRQLDGVVTGIAEEPCAEGEESINGCGTATVRVEALDLESVEVPLPGGPGAPEIAEGDEVVLLRSSLPDAGEAYAIVDHQRSTQLWVLAAAFVLAVVAFGRWRGVTALLGLVATFALLLFFVVPAILAGESPLLVAIVGSAAIILLVLPLTHGLSVQTTVAVAGTLGALTLTGVLGAVSVSTLHLTGFADESSTNLGVVFGLNVQGLLLAGIVIGSLGVLDDVTVTQAATVTELSRADPSAGFRDLYRAASRVGRSHIASVINTIILAYAGSSLPLLILIAGSDVALGPVVSDQVIAQEIVRSVVATLGLIAAVPITTALAAATAGRVTDEVTG